MAPKVVAVDDDLRLLTRIWVIAEIAEATGEGLGVRV